MKELIYNQTRIPKEKWRYGFRSSAKVGCGWVATSNALVLMGYDVDVEHLIRSCERQAPLINGTGGTLFFGPGLLLKKWGFPVVFSNNPRNYDQICKECDVAILFYYWRSGMKIGSHFVAVRHTEDGFIGYNTYTNSNGPDSYGPSLEAFLKKRHYFATVLCGIRKK